MQRECVICNKLFTPCSTDFDSVLGNWRVRCCTIECGQLYYQKIMESRNPQKTSEELKNKSKQSEISDNVETIENDTNKSVEETPVQSYRRRR